MFSCTYAASLTASLTDVFALILPTQLTIAASIPDKDATVLSICLSKTSGFLKLQLLHRLQSLFLLTHNDSDHLYSPTPCKQSADFPHWECLGRGPFRGKGKFAQCKKRYNSTMCISFSRLCRRFLLSAAQTWWSCVSLRIFINPFVIPLNECCSIRQHVLYYWIQSPPRFGSNLLYPSPRYTKDALLPSNLFASAPLHP